METFYEKIFIFFLNFKNAQKGVKHFKDLITILEITIEKFKTWKSTMSKLYLLTLLHEIIASIKQYLLHFDTRAVLLGDNEYPDLNDDFLDMIEEESYRATGEKTIVDRESNILHYPGPVLTKLNSVIPSKEDQENENTEELQNKILWRDLPENLVKIFEIIVNLSVEDEPVVRKVHQILFEIFKAVIWELNLFSIIKMNKLMVSKCKILMTYDKKIPQKSVKLMIITLDCFHEFIVILNKKLDQSRTRDGSDANQLVITDGGEVIEINEVLRMFEGIVDFILKGLFGHSTRVTEKIYMLLKDILAIEGGMEEIVSISLFESIKSEINRSLLPKTHEILEKMFTLIHPLTFIRIIMVYSHKVFMDELKIEKQRFIVETMISISTNTLIKNIGKHFEDVSEQIFNGYNQKLNKWIDLWAKDPVSFLKICIFNFKFELAEKILNFEIENRSDHSKLKDISEFENNNMSSMANSEQETKRRASSGEILVPKKNSKKKKSKKLGYYKRKNDESLSIFILKLEGVYSLLTSQSFSRRVSFVLDNNLKENLLKFAGLLTLLRKSDKNSVLDLKRLSNLQTSNFLSKVKMGYKEPKKDVEEQLLRQYLNSRRIIQTGGYLKKGESDSSYPEIITPTVRRRKTSGNEFRRKIENDNYPEIDTPIVRRKDPNGDEFKKKVNGNFAELTSD